MNSKDKLVKKVSVDQSLSSSVQGTPEKNGYSNDASRSPELLHEFIKSGPAKDHLRLCSHKEMNISGSSKRKLTESERPINQKIKKHDHKKVPSNAISQPLSRKQPKKGRNPIRHLITPHQASDFGSSDSWICKNSACRATLSKVETFCKRCSCSICHLFDDNKDPSLWLVCTSDSCEGDFCGLSCHVECALRSEKVGVLDLGQLMQLDGSYCCASCGKVSSILGFWKKQLTVAKDARRLDVLCYRIYLSDRLLKGTSRFKELHDIVNSAKAKLEIETGPLDGTSAKRAHGIVSRLSVAGDVQKLCFLAIEKADEWLAKESNVKPTGSLPAACKFLFNEVTPRSVSIFLIESAKGSADSVEGYKLWFYKSTDEKPTKEPICVFPRTQRRILISNLLPCTEYTFRIISYTETGDLGHSEAKCFTKSVEIPCNRKEKNNTIEGSSSNVKENEAAIPNGPQGFKVREHSKILHLLWAKEQGLADGSCSADAAKCCGASNAIKSQSTKRELLPSGSRELDLNVASVPDLNEDLTPPFDSSRDECTLERDVDDAASHGIENNGLVRSQGSQGPVIEVPAVDSDAKLGLKTNECDSTLVNNASSLQNSDSVGCLDENFEYCVKIIRWLERGGYIDQEFRKKLLTWFSLRSTEQERRIVNAFIQTLIDDPYSLADQLVHSLSKKIISNGRSGNGF